LKEIKKNFSIIAAIDLGNFKSFLKNKNPKGKLINNMKKYLPHTT
tara:strand:+ start:141 stop:275 length:135 start_codon:yes stop_codon:yes gene_type:complete